MTKSYLRTIPSPSRKEVIAPCQGGGEIREYELPENETHKGPFQPQKDAIIEHNDTHRNYPSILAILE